MPPLELLLEGAKLIAPSLLGMSAESENEKRRKAYLDQMNQLSQEGEQSFLGESSSQLPELQNLQESIKSGNNKQMQDALSQQTAEFAKQGMRGGQLQTATNRASGDIMTRGMNDVNQLAYNEAMQRRQARQGYFANKANQGRTGAMMQPQQVNTSGILGALMPSIGAK